MNIGIVIADEYEYNPFREFAKTKNCTETIRHGRESLTYTDGTHKITAVQCGIGKVNAAAATAYLIDGEKSDVILNAGLSGAISGLRKGDVVAAQTYAECDFDLTAVGYDLGAKPGQISVFTSDEKLLALALSIEGIRKAKLGTGDVFLTDKERGRAYHELFDIAAFDMETAAIASVCHFDNIPFLSIRKISDNADDTASEDYHEMNDRQEQDLTLVLTEIIKKIK